MTKKQILKAFPPTHYMVAEVFGQKLYVSQNLDHVVTDKIGEAAIWNPELEAVKLRFYRAWSGWDFHFEPVN
ncbi:MAG TPA: hypothetical protein VHO03_16885 [Ignavibacteriales bacterium]|nr:hypothetical protein [Ignavibacteriales bacterium]